MSKCFTAAVVYDTSAINRDEKIGNNVLSIKKMTINGETYSAISRPSQTHHLFNTLNMIDGETWRASHVKPSGSGSKKVVQFDLTKENILNSAELDFFGYMGTESMNMRKSPIGITKAVSLYPWKGDMLFYANHGLVKRAKEVDPSIQPNPYSKEEHSSFYKTHFTIDNNRIGNDYWLIEEGSVEETSDGLKITTSKKSNNVEFSGFRKQDENIFVNNDGSAITIEKLSETEKALKVSFGLAESIRKKRIESFLKAIRNGIVFHSSGEAPGLNPVFIIAAVVDVPMPVFNGYIQLSPEKEAKIASKTLEQSLMNEYIQNYFLFDGIGLLDNAVNTEKPKTDDWGTFVEDYLKEE